MQYNTVKQMYTLIKEPDWRSLHPNSLQHVSYERNERMKEVVSIVCNCQYVKAIELRFLKLQRQLLGCWRHFYNGKFNQHDIKYS